MVTLFFYFLHIVVIARSQHLFVALELIGLLLALSAFYWLFNTFFVQRLVQLNLSVLKDIPEVLGDTVVRSQILLSKVDCLLVAQDCCRIRLQKFLLDSHIMVSNCQHRGSVFVRIWGHCLLVSLCILIVGVAIGVKLFREHHFLKQNYCGHCVIERQLVLVQLRQDSTDIQMSVGLDFRSLKLGLNGQSLLQEIEC